MSTKVTYPDDWPEIAQAVKQLAGWKCANCLHPHDPSSGHTLTVHHFDHNTFNNEPSNLMALCQKCHLRLEGRYRTLTAQSRKRLSLFESGFRHLPGFEPQEAPQLSSRP